MECEMFVKGGFPDDREQARYKLDLVGVQEVRWEGGGTEPAGEYTFFYGKGKENHELSTVFFCA
jgi:hypothetical protein